MKKTITAVISTAALLGITPAAHAAAWDVQLDPGQTMNVPAPIAAPLNVDCFSGNRQTQYDETIGGTEIRFWWRHNGSSRLRAKYFGTLSPNGTIVNVGTVTVYCQVIYAGYQTLGWAGVRRVLDDAALEGQA